MTEPKRLFHVGHTNKIAATLGRAHEHGATPEVLLTVWQVFGKMLAADNPEFDVENFADVFVRHYVETADAMLDNTTERV